MNRIVFSLFFLLNAFLCMAQTQLNGQVVDSVSQSPITGASVVFQRNGRTLKFARTDSQGRFAIAVPAVQEGDSLQVSALGYRKQKFAATAHQPLQIALTEEAFVLKEVQIKASRITARQDTTTFDLTRFASERDNNLQDVLKKLPGVDVADNGQISFNGKAINRFTVEGLDLTGGRYNQLTESIKAQDVKKAEVIEHDQPIKALQDKVFTDNVAMNIDLKDEVRDKLMPTLKPYVQVGEPTHVGGGATLLQIGRRRQLMYEGEYDRTGRDLSQSSNILASLLNHTDEASLPSFLSAPGLASPIDEDRLRFNTSQRYHVNAIKKTANDNEYRINAGYFREVFRQHTSNQSLYWLTSETPILTTEDEHLLSRKDRLTLSVDHKLNTERVFGQSRLNLSAAQTDALSSLSSHGDTETQSLMPSAWKRIEGLERFSSPLGGRSGEGLSQQIRLPELNVSGSIYRLWTLSKGTLSWRSMGDYHHGEYVLRINDGRNAFRANLWHTQHSLSWLRKTRFFTQEYEAGVEAENLNVDASNTRLALYAAPRWQYERGQMDIRLSAHTSLVRFTRQQKTLLLLNPHLYLTLKNRHHGETSVGASLTENAGDWTDLALDAYQTNYRTHYTFSGLMPRTRTAMSTIGYNYKRAVREFFWSVSANVYRSWLGVMSDLQILDGKYFYSLTAKHNQTDGAGVSGYISKGFFDLHLKTRLRGQMNFSRGEQLSSGALTAYDSRSYSLSPFVEFSPRWGALSYDGRFTVSNAHSQTAGRMGSLTTWRQRLALTATVADFDLTLSAVHHHNELRQGSPLNCLLTDARVVWRRKKLRLSAELTNLFNKTEYAVTTYSGVASLTNEYVLRPREFLLRCQVSF